MTRYEDLVAWQRMHELSVEVWKAGERPPLARDFKFRDQLRDAADSPQRNIAEGFGRFSPNEFAHFLNIARGSALETTALPRKARAIGYLEQEDLERLEALANRGVSAVARLQRYLRSPSAHRNAARRYQ